MVCFFGSSGLFVFISPFLKIMEELYSGAGAACNSGASELSPIFCGVHVAQLYSSLWHFVNHCLSFCVLYLLDTALSVSLSFTASDIFNFSFYNFITNLITKSVNFHPSCWTRNRIWGG